MLIKGLYIVTKATHEGDTIKASVHLNADHPVFKGHFPDQPVMPGVCTVQIVQELLEQHLAKPLRLRTASNIKFMALIDPRTSPDLDVDISHAAMEEGVKVTAKVSFGTTVAMKLSAEFQVAGP